MVLGFIHVDMYGRINKWGTIYDDREDISMYPKRYPRISGKDAREKARDLLSKYKEVKLSEPIYVYTEGKVAWMLLRKKTKS